MTFTRKLLFFICFLSVYDQGNADVALQQFGFGSRKFTGDVYAILADQSNNNIIFSPLSAQIILSQTTEGARNRTATQLVTALHLPKRLLTHSAIKQLNFDIRTDKFTLLSANKIYISTNYKLLQSFLEVSKEVYKSEIETINFSYSQKAAKSINNWVEQHTNNKIQDIINPNSLSPATPLVLVNALYINAKWNTPFRHKLTTDGIFYLPDGRTKIVPMMNSYNRGGSYYNFARSTKLGADSLRLDLENSNLSVTFVLSHERYGLKRVEDNLEVFLEQKDYTHERVAVSIPRFEITSGSIDLRRVLEQLGVSDLFDPNSANLSGISNQLDLIVGSVVQKAFINVTEAGIEAAAATDIGFIRSALLPKPTVSFKADHPFVYFISDRNTGTVYFVGRYVGL